MNIGRTAAGASSDLLLLLSEELRGREVLRVLLSLGVHWTRTFAIIVSYLRGRVLTERGVIGGVTISMSSRLVGLCVGVDVLLAFCRICGRTIPLMGALRRL